MPFAGEQMDEYSRALDEYRVICEYHRAEDQLKWSVMSISLSGSLILGGVAATMRYSWASLAVAIASAAVATAGVVTYSRISRYTLWRLARAWELETTLGFNNHLLIRDHYAKLPRRSRVNSVLRVSAALPWVLVAAYAVAVGVHHFA